MTCKLFCVFLLLPIFWVHMVQSRSFYSTTTARNLFHSSTPRSVYHSSHFPKFYPVTATPRFHYITTTPRFHYITTTPRFHYITTTRRHFGKHTVIINPRTQLVLDGSEGIVKARRSTNSPGQSWYINHTDYGTFYFVNKKTNKVLSIQKGWASWDHKVVTTDFNRISEYQQWYVNPDGSIVNAGDKELALEIDIFDKLVLERRSVFGSDRQVFKITSY